MNILIVLTDPIKDMQYLMKDIVNIVGDNKLTVIHDKQICDTKSEYDFVFVHQDTAKTISADLTNLIIDRRGTLKPVHITKLAKWDNAYHLYRVAGVKPITDTDNTILRGEMLLGINVTNKLRRYFYEE